MAMQIAGTEGHNPHHVAGRICLRRNLRDRAPGSRSVRAVHNQSADGLLVEYDDNRVLGRERDECVSIVCSDDAKANRPAADLTQNHNGRRGPTEAHAQESPRSFECWRLPIRW